MYLETEYRTGNRAWCARIIGVGVVKRPYFWVFSKWKFNREFFNRTRQGVRIHEVNEGDIIEEVVYSHSGKNRSADYYTVQGGNLVKTSERDVLSTLKGQGK